jgi:hypothetical protein
VFSESRCNRLPSGNRGLSLFDVNGGVLASRRIPVCDPLPHSFRAEYQWRDTPSSARNSPRSIRAARELAKEYFERYPKDQYQTEVESWRNLQSANIEFTMKRLREPIDG